MNRAITIHIARYSSGGLPLDLRFRDAVQGLII